MLTSAPPASGVRQAAVVWASGHCRRLARETARSLFSACRQLYRHGLYDVPGHGFVVPARCHGRSACSSMDAGSVGRVAASCRVSGHAASFAGSADNSAEPASIRRIPRALRTRAWVADDAVDADGRLARSASSPSAPGAASTSRHRTQAPVWPWSSPRHAPAAAVTSTRRPSGQVVRQARDGRLRLRPIGNWNHR
jgi:hypothetical protein